jgi:protein-disulfide isomerase
MSKNGHWETVARGLELQILRAPDSRKGLPEMERPALSDIGIGLLACFAIGLAGLAGWREFHPVAEVTEAQRVDSITDWKKYAAVGPRRGGANPKITITEFSDFECPVCRRYATILDEIRQRYPERVATVYRHYPLEGIHPYARDAALAAVCAADQGRFDAYHDALFAAQDSLASSPWMRLAIQNAVKDTAQFSTCMHSDHARNVLFQDVKDGDALGVKGTPTILVNGLKFAQPPGLPTLDSLVRAESGS